MNWIRENKFLTGLLVGVILGAAVLGFLAYSAFNQFTEASSQYDTQAQELKRLQNLVPYPSEENLNKLREQKAAVAAGIGELAQQLNAREFPEEPLRPTEFQDRLRAAVSTATENAQQNGVQALPANFYLGMGEYQTTLPPDDAAASQLGRDLKAIAFAVDRLIESKPESVLNVDRIVEARPAATPRPATPPGRPAAAAGGTPAGQQPLVMKRSFELTFLIEQNGLRTFLNSIVSAKQGFFVIRNIRIKNQVEKGPSRVEGGETGAAAPTTETAPGEAPKPPGLRFITGTEKVEVAARLDVLDFNPPPLAQK